MIDDNIIHTSNLLRNNTKYKKGKPSPQLPMPMQRNKVDQKPHHHKPVTHTYSRPLFYNALKIIMLAGYSLLPPRTLGRDFQPSLLRPLGLPKSPSRSRMILRAFLERR